jgi:hypothetical protein
MDNKQTLTKFIPTKEEIELILAIRDLTRFEKIEVKPNPDNVKEIVWTLTSNYRQVYSKGA